MGKAHDSLIMSNIRAKSNPKLKNWLEWYIHPHKGRLVQITRPKGANAKALEIGRQTFPVNGGTLFNSLPYNLRNLTDVSMDRFKGELDSFLETVPDCPLSSYLFPDPINPISGKNSNCLIDWIRHLGLNRRTYTGDTSDHVNSA